MENLDNDYIADFIDEAADILEKDGWIKGSAHGHGQGTPTEDLQGHCALGSLDHVYVKRGWMACSNGVWKSAYHRLLDRLRREAPSHDLIHWNDDPARTKQEVLDFFRATAKELRE